MLLRLLLFSALKLSKISLAATPYVLLAFVPAKVLAKDVKLEVVILNGRLQVNEAKLPQKVSPKLK